MSLRSRIPFKAFTPPPGWRSDVPRPLLSLEPIQIGGVSVMNLLTRGPQIVPGGLDCVMTQVNYGVMKIHILWPGYKAETLDVDLYATQARMTRGALAVLVAKHLMNFMQRCKTTKISPSAATWRIGDGSILPHNVIINTLYNTYENVWQAALEVDI